MAGHRNTPPCVLKKLGADKEWAVWHMALYERNVRYGNPLCGGPRPAPSERKSLKKTSRLILEIGGFWGKDSSKNVAEKIREELGSEVKIETEYPSKEELNEKPRKTAQLVIESAKKEDLFFLHRWAWLYPPNPSRLIIVTSSGKESYTCWNRGMLFEPYPDK